MTVTDGRGKSVSQQTGVLKAQILTPQAAVVVRLTIAVLVGGDEVIILGSKTPREQPNIDLTEGLSCKGGGSW